MNQFLLPAIAALVVLGVFFVLAQLATGSPDYKGRLTRFVGGEGQAKEDKKKADKKRFNLGIGETQIAARVDKAMQQQTFGRTVQRRLAQADLKLTLSEFMLVKLFSVAIGLLFGLYLGRGGPVEQILFSIAGIVVGFFAPDWYVKFRLGRRLKAFNEQLGDTISLLANSLRSGYSMLQSMELVARESADPIGSEFKRVVREVGLGLSPQDALSNLLRRMPSDDLDLLITAINIQYEVGGNLAQILDIISHTIRERVRIKGEIQVLTAMGRTSGYIISGLPIFLAVAITLMNPTYMSSMWAFPWIIMPICAGLLMLVGFLVIKKIVTIEV